VAATPSVRVVKSFLFKGGTRLYSNRYHFNGGTPADATHWHTLMDNIVNAEKAALYANSTIVECLGYAAGSDVPVATKVYSTAGTHTGTGGNEAPGECAALVRYSTAARTTKNHPIYLFNYYHNALLTTSGASGQDKLLASQATSFATYASSWISGFSDGTITAVRASPNGAAATGSIVEEWLTHRDFPYSTSV
jgi:hypothetical protein